MTRAGGIVFSRPSTERLDAMLLTAATSELTYDHIGSTLDDPPGATIHSQERVLGSGQTCFDHAVAGLRVWACHGGLGARVHPADAALTVGANALVVLPAGPFAIVVPDRVVAVVDEPRRFGFAYGTLDGHQERGEESFVVEYRDDDTVVATIAVEAEAATLASRVAAPLVRRFQHLAIGRYLRGLQTYVDGRR
ncbi:MAG: DUF1990 family protein [Microthrixaceae bacterium]